MYKILAVDDDFNLSESLKFTLSESKILKVDFFGIDIEKIEKNSFKNIIANNFIEYAKRVDISNSYDLLLLDYNMPNYNAEVILDECKNLPPVILMSADFENTENLENNIIKLLVSRKAKRYIFKNSNIFTKELEILVEDIIEEKNNTKTLKIIEDLLLNENIDSFEAFAKELSSNFMDSFPNTLMVIRAYEQTDNSLKKVHDIDGLNIDEIIKKDNNEDVFCSLESDNGYCIDNEFLLKDRWDSFAKRLNSDKARFLTIRLGSKERPIGVVNITKPIDSSPFNDKSVKSYKRVLDIATTKLKLTKKRMEDLEIFELLSKLSLANDEKELLEEYVKTIHKIFNNNSNQNKTTIKLRDLKNDTLVFCCGVCPPKKEHFEPKTSDNTISSYVYFYNIPILIEDTKDENKFNESWKRFEKDLKESLYYINKIKKFKYVNPQKDLEMRSELCLPISGNSSVLGVLNLESVTPNFYNKEQLEFLQKLNTIVANLILSLRIKDLSNSLMDAFSLFEESKKYEKIKKSLQKHLGFFAMMLFKYEDNQLKLDKDAIHVEDKRVSIIKIQNSFKYRSKKTKSYIDWAKEVFLSKGYRGIYIPYIDLEFYISVKENDIETKEEELKFLPFHKGLYDIKSIYFQAIYSNTKELLAIIMLEYNSENPLRVFEIELLNSSVKILANMLYSNSSLKKEEAISRFINQSIRTHFSNFRHTVLNRIKAIEKSLTTEQKEVIEAIKRATYGFDRAIEKNDIKSIFNAIRDELYLNQSDIDAIFKGENIEIKESKKELIYLLLFHLMLNAKEHLESLEIDKKEIKLEVIKDREIVELRLYDSGELPKDIDRIFEQGYSTKGKSGGYGLYYLKETIESIGAELEFVKNPKYFRFTIDKNSLLKDL